MENDARATPETVPEADGETDFLDLSRRHLDDAVEVAGAFQPWRTCGRLVRVAGMIMEAVGMRLAVGSTCWVRTPDGQRVEAEVVGFSGNRLFLMPAADVYGLLPGTLVVPADAPPLELPPPGESLVPRRRGEDKARRMPVGMELLGRVVDAAGRPLDGRGPVPARQTAPLYSRPFNPMERDPIHDVLDTGVRAINGLLTVGKGQRLGLFAGSGVGKSVLLGSMARYTSADVIVVGLIGERGREVKDFIENILGDEGLARAVVVAAPADTSPLMRLHGAAYASAVAEFFRDQGMNVLLLMDSLTRYAMAQREIALSIGEPPATKGYPPSAFAKLPQLVERAGNGPPGGGTITAFYTVLAEGDDQQDPVADSARAILDGHVVLTRALADQGHYPAIDIEASVSRAMPELASEEDMNRARRFRQLWSSFQRNRDLIAVGAYVRGNDPVLDEAMERHTAMQGFLRQGMRERVTVDEARHQLAAVLG